MKNKKIGITGATGFLGRYVLEELEKKEINFLIIKRESEKVEEKYSQKYKNTDYSIESLKEVLVDIDGVIHLAARRGANFRIDDFHLNEIITQNIFHAAMEIGIKDIAFTSSISVYSDSNMLPWNENQVSNPVNMYGISKLVNEKVARIYSEKYKMYIKSLRLAHLYGSKEKNNYMINIFMRKAFLGKKIETNNIEAKREFLYARDAANAIILSLFKKENGVFNIGTNDVLTNLEVAEKINMVFENITNIDVKKSDNNIESSFMSSKKAKEKLGYCPKYNFVSALKEIKKEMRDWNDIQEVY